MFSTFIFLKFICHTSKVHVNKLQHQPQYEPNQLLLMEEVKLTT